MTKRKIIYFAIALALLCAVAAAVLLRSEGDKPEVKSAKFVIEGENYPQTGRLREEIR